MVLFILVEIAVMIRMAFVLCVVLFACNDDKTNTEEPDGFSYGRFSELFRPLNLPYQLSDTGLMKNKDTTAIRSSVFASFLPDSLKSKLFEKGSKIKYIALGQLKSTGDKNYYLLKAVSGNKKIALLYIFEKENFSSVFPFLIPDNDPATTQSTVADKSLSITKNIFLRQPGNVIEEGKDVYGYDADLKQFTLVLTNPIGGYSELTNPIDTFPRKHKLAGDYGKDKTNIVSIRDGRNPNQLLLYIHVENEDGSCTGEVKGDILVTSPTTAIYRQGGDPCVLSFRFSGSTVTVKEDEGCGSRRGLDCSFDGSYNKKKPQKTKPAAKKTVGK